LCPPRVPEVFAAWYLAPHSFIVSASAGGIVRLTNPTASTAIGGMAFVRTSMWRPPIRLGGNITLAGDVTAVIQDCTMLLVWASLHEALDSSAGKRLARSCRSL